MRIMYVTRANIRAFGATEGRPGFDTGRSMPHNNECRMRIRTRMEKDEDGREGLKNEQRSPDRNLEKAVARSSEEDAARKACGD